MYTFMHHAFCVALEFAILQSLQEVTLLCIVV